MSATLDYKESPFSSFITEGKDKKAVRFIYTPKSKNQANLVLAFAVKDSTKEPKDCEPKGGIVTVHNHGDYYSVATSSKSATDLSKRKVLSWSKEALKDYGVPFKDRNSVLKTIKRFSTADGEFSKISS